MTVNDGPKDQNGTASWLGPLGTFLRNLSTAPGERGAPAPTDSLFYWELFKKSYDAWDQALTPTFEKLLKSPNVLQPGATLLGSFTQLRQQQERGLTLWWALWGLPTRADQQRTLHALHELQSRLIDLEEKLHDLEARATPALPVEAE